ncbi:tripartite tricarboxylate transporter TctB family protein [Casimicrobium huifangae]|uniref:tripartite tricarboxylate transporter TctB family protein n=1 Tax=Casimicrobium huifangae TaxID=2591109 RepID=UPI0012ECB33D|nr:tripartite tricarboxylate transporter TctB family protein [Casimicrobium huifangae]HOA99975.1 tripartite tricarboxylate transporter TctB family protein [Casimicrobium huifangae]HQA33010.1 tripartite tricarboxylate transporter TctB family protein [Casimicrobium huifangae]
MNSFLKNKDLLAGLMFIVIGVVFFVGAYNYQMGTAARMGPGYFPRILGGVMAVLGVIVAGIGLKNQAQWAATDGIGWTWKPVIILTAAVVLFGATLPSLGMVIAIILLTIISGIAAHDKNYRELAIITVIMCLFCAAVFVWGLKLQMKLFPWS